MESVETTVVIPNLLPNKDDSVDLPHPLVPHKSTVTDSFLSLILQARRKSAFWFGPTYLYEERASHTTLRNFSLETTMVVWVLYNSKGMLLRVASKILGFSISTSFTREGAFSSLSAVSDLDASKNSLLITLNTLLLILKAWRALHPMSWRVP
ncbi:Os02g0819450 [Oryza sativa Japonica Group]|uniref:Os02g0819450 protein n=1 Tax=Oryza sativa subsp. japonica TaxID=39947 RepID=A0A0N7KGC2_ORYSJ|nr:hypothetical protein EE612_014498 [Oryza sativa]BAS81609.1 Os02g0819450 [Oryza sativa Japonica Group]